MASIARVTGGNFRLLQRLFVQIERILRINDLSMISDDVVEAARSTLVICVFFARILTVPHFGLNWRQTLFGANSVAGVAWPSNSFTTRREAPAVIKWVAAEWRGW